jgi:hypothetical protein
MLKDRHIDQNLAAILAHLKQNALADILPKIYWEKNTLVSQNPNIPASQIIPKSKTGDFPAEAITIRMNSQKRKIATAYFYGDKHTRTYGNSHTWTYVDEQLRVTLPMKGYNKKDYSYHFQGQLPTIFDMQDLCWALEYIKEQFNTMTGDKTA